MFIRKKAFGDLHREIRELRDSCEIFPISSDYHRGKVQGLDFALKTLEEFFPLAFRREVERRLIDAKGIYDIQPRKVEIPPPLQVESGEASDQGADRLIRLLDSGSTHSNEIDQGLKDRRESLISQVCALLDDHGIAVQSVSDPLNHPQAHNFANNSMAPITIKIYPDEQKITLIEEDTIIQEDELNHVV